MLLHERNQERLSPEDAAISTYHEWVGALGWVDEELLVARFKERLSNSLLAMEESGVGEDVRERYRERRATLLDVVKVIARGSA